MVGITGVIWYPRGAAPNSAALIAGAGPVPLTIAGDAWSAVAAGLGDTASTVTRVMANLRTGWSGDAADAALTKFGPFQEWAAQSAALALTTGGKAQVQATAYTVAAVMMPPLPEIMAVDTAKIAAYSLGGALTGAAAAAETAAELLKIQAATAMETYDSASAHLAVRQEFNPPPSIATSDIAAHDTRQVAVVGPPPVSAFIEPVRTAAAAIASVVSNPVFGAAVSQVGTALGGTVLGGAAAATNAAAAAGATAITAAGAVSAGAGLGTGLGAGAASPLSSPLTALTGLAGGTTGRHAAATTAAAATSPFGTGSSANGGVGAGSSLRVESSASQITPRAASAAPSGAVMNAGSADALRTDTVRTDPARSQSGSGSAPMGGGRHAAKTDDDSEDHDTPDYLKHFEHFADGRTVIPSVIGVADEDVQP
ncbi:PPE domain-containing protein [Rhodococcus sp. IEGM 1379]|uniref:PPE domain-containing protein n=1 Tax=Rhodococcus sp. IEGM 1379 TaxID=3047086 RepID=UPI0024B802A9|nr:PPE domain-containing protein [Rhodococcus sp. IEGM 1379]MDI9918607.1 PPE domain-containing protein [Rhodococcus sp. IEGM 1379]